MGQYHYVVNLDKKQYLHPHRFGDGLKLLEFGCSGEGTMTALAILLADSNGRDGGDLHSDNPIIGSWAGDRITITGDYGDNGRWLDGVTREEANAKIKEHEDYRDDDGEVEVDELNLYTWADLAYEEISAKIIEAMRDDAYLKESLDKAYKYGG